MFLDRDKLGEETGGIAEIFNEFFAFILNQVTHFEQFVDLALVLQTFLQESPFTSSQFDLL